MQLVAHRSGEIFPSFHITTSVHTGIVALFSHLPVRMHALENTGDWRLLVAGILIAALLYPLYLIFLHPLNRYPGPFLAKVTDYWRFQNVLGRRSHLEMVAVHKKYGIVVRTGPNTLSISDPDYIPKIYGPGHGFLKVFHLFFFALNHGTASIRRGTCTSTDTARVPRAPFTILSRAGWETK